MITSLLELADALGRLEPTIYLFGGVAEDAVLDGALTRPHGDVDVMVPATEVERRLEQFRGLGFAEWEVWQADSNGEPQVLHSRNESDVHLEVSVLSGGPGSYFFELPDPGGDGHFHLIPPGDIFDAPPVVLDGVTIHTVSPLTLFSIRESLAAAGSFGPYRPQDGPVQARLRALLRDRDAADLAPRLVKVDR